jgi:NitT/TauT family transport system ATP-binding protein
MSEKLPFKLKLDRIGKSFPMPKGERLEVLRSISLEVNSGECISILGKSGCGKSTLLRIIAGIEKPDSGMVHFINNNHYDKKTRVAMVPQDFSAFPWLTVLENISFGLLLLNVPAKVRREKSTRIIDDLGLKGFENTYPKALSGGMKQRVAIGRAIAVEPSLLLLDEPFGSLDAFTREQMQDFFINLRQQLDTCLVFVTHDIEEALYVGDRYAVISSVEQTISITDVVHLPRRRTQELKTTPEFQEQRRKLREYLN